MQSSFLGDYLTKPSCRVCAACLLLLGFALLCFTGVAFLTNGRQDPPPAKRLHPALLRYWLSYGGLEWNPQYLWGMPVLVPYRCCNISPPIHWPQHKFILLSIIPEIRSQNIHLKGLKSRCPPGLFLLEAPGVNPILVSSTFRDCWLSWLHHFCLDCCGHIPFSSTTDKSCSASLL